MTSADSLPQIAARLFPILKSLAVQKKTTTYGQASDVINWANARSMSQPLNLIENWCARNKLPPLHVLVVQKKTGLPGRKAGLGGAATPEIAIARVFDHDWSGVVAPSPSDLDI